MYRDRSEWVRVPVPATVSQELFDRVQKRKADNRKRYRNPRKQQLLSWLVRSAVPELAKRSLNTRSRHSARHLRALAL